ncbi:hypothetical protein [Alkalibaculum sporogenes]|uniref:hypothetical protein n=1 Tax=Alkalibaculum sporogenes TaxID=2655001 RepID=UPI00187B58D4|nr:hypothetical protein [Alkalibaculum sporogenes]
MRLKLVLSWLIGGFSAILVMLVVMRVTGNDIPSWFGFIIMVGCVLFLQKFVFKK